MSLIKHNRTISRPIKHLKNMKNIFRNIKHSCRMNEEAYVHKQTCDHRVANRTLCGAGSM